MATTRSMERQIPTLLFVFVFLAIQLYDGRTSNILDMTWQQQRYHPFFVFDISLRLPILCL